MKAYDDRCLQSLELALSGGVVMRENYTFPSCAGSTTGRDHSFYIDVPSDAPHGENVLISLVATDSAGQLSNVATELRARDTVSPAVELISPQQDILVEPGETIEFLLRVSDTSGIDAEVRLGGGCMFHRRLNPRMQMVSSG